MTTSIAAHSAEATKFVEQFIIAVDFQQPVPISVETNLADLDEWDSLAALGVIVMCDTEYGVAVTGEDLKAATTVGELLNRVLQLRAA